MPRRRRAPAGVVDEASWQTTVTQAAGLYGWRHYHTHDSRRSVAGFPDLVLLRGAELLFVELKTDTGRVRPEQRVWLEELGELERLIADPGQPGICVEVHLWRPRDWDEVNARLARGRHRLERAT